MQVDGKFLLADPDCQDRELVISTKFKPTKMSTADVVPFSSSHTFYFDTKTPVTARTLAESLIGLEETILASQSVIACLLGSEGEVKEMNVLVTSIKIASYEDSFLVRMLLGKGKRLESNIEKVRKMLKLDDKIKNMNQLKIVGVVIAGAIVWVALKGCSPEDPNRIVIQNSFNTIAAEANLTGEDMQDLIESLLSKGKQVDLRKRVTQLIHPNGVQHDGTIQIDGNKNLAIPAEAVRKIPTLKIAVEDSPDVEDLDDKQIVVRALDLDSTGKGWWAIVPEITDRRLPLHLLPEVYPPGVPIGKYFQANITVIYSSDLRGNRKPKQYLLRKVPDSLLEPGQ